MTQPPSKDAIQYAMENTQVLREPDRRIDTFGNTGFEFVMISELMDSVNKIRVRSGEVVAEKPQIITPDAYKQVQLEGFDEEAGKFLAWLKDKGLEPVFFQYGFTFRRTEASEEILTDSLEAVRDRVLAEAVRQDNPILAVIEGVDDTWEVGLLKFAIDMIEKSHEINQFDFKRRGLL